MRPTIYDVAGRAGVSIATVSRVLNGRLQTSEASRDRVLRAVEELHYIPNSSARGLSHGLKRIVGLVFAGTPFEETTGLRVEEENLLFTDSVIRGADVGAQRHGYSLLLSGTEAGDPGRSVPSLMGKVDGLLVLDRVLPARGVAPLAKRIPVVMLAGNGRTRAAASVRVDNAGGMTALAEHLVGEHGYRRLAFVSGLEDSPDNSLRAATFQRAVTELGGSVEPLDRWSADWTSGGAVATVRRVLDAGWTPPEAIACANDQMAVGVVHALSRAGYKVPTDVAVVGFDDITLARRLSPTLTTVRQPSFQLGLVAAQTLVDLIERNGPARDVVLPTELQLRASCGCPGEDDDDTTTLWRVSV